MNENKLLCANCYTMTDYTIKTKRVSKEIEGKTYYYIRQFGECDTCHEEIFVPGLEEINHNTLNDVYRKENNIITIEDIQMIMDKYRIEKRPLSLILGFGEITIKRYMDGSIPSKRYSDILKHVLADPMQMKNYLELNKDKITKAAYQKTCQVIGEMILNDSCDSKIELIACYIRDNIYEVTNMSLQKLLYYIQALSGIINGQWIFEDLCQAWMHGPVYPKVYDKYKRYGASIINHCDLVIDYENLLEEKERELIDLIIHSFGKYNGSVLRNLTHKESPWMNERAMYREDDICTNEISIDEIKRYFEKVYMQYNLSTEEGIDRYIKHQLKAGKN